MKSIPQPLRRRVEQIWLSDVRGGRQRYLETGDLSGRTGQWKISRLPKEAGIPEADPRWVAVIAHGRVLYYGHVKT